MNIINLNHLCASLLMEGSKGIKHFVDTFRGRLNKERIIEYIENWDVDDDEVSKLVNEVTKLFT